MRPMTIPVSGLLGLFLANACSPGPAPIAVSSRDPSNPAAPEGVAEHRHEHAQRQATDAGVGYVCPMHPEVTSSSPGSCPKCGMKLVPKS